jgi:hypothetical protein
MACRLAGALKSRGATRGKRSSRARCQRLSSGGSAAAWGSHSCRPIAARADRTMIRTQGGAPASMFCNRSVIRWKAVRSE